VASPQTGTLTPRCKIMLSLKNAGIFRSSTRASTVKSSLLSAVPSALVSSTSLTTSLSVPSCCQSSGKFFENVTLRSGSLTEKDQLPRL